MPEPSNAADRAPAYIREAEPLPVAARRIRRAEPGAHPQAPAARGAPIRGGIAFLVSLLGAAAFWGAVNGVYPVEKWLFWSFAYIWLYAATFAVAALCGGYRVLEWLRFELAAHERLVLATATGTLLFGTGIFAFGLFGCLGPTFFLAWPSALIVAGIVPATRHAARALAARRRPGDARADHRPTWGAAVVFAFGCVGVLMVYIPILTPANVAYDARWYHLALAEHYAAGGAIARFPEGVFQGAYPHFASYLYTWAFLLPNSDLWQRIELAAHLEFVVFLFTLIGVAAAIRWCTDGRGVKAGWAAVFLFPSLLVYDSTLACGSDHVLAFWAVPILLATRLLWRRLDVASAALLGMVSAGAVMTKFHAIYLVVGPALVLAGRLARPWLWRRPASRWPWRARSPRRRTLWVAAACVASALFFSQPLWLKNWVWYGDPLYPMLGKIFSRRPWVADANSERFLELAAWTPQGSLGHRLEETLRALFTFSVKPHDWWNLHRNTPVFGSLFTLSLPLIALARPWRRTAALAAATSLGVAIWFWTYHQDRYLQALLPWMAVVVAATLGSLWRAGWLARTGVAILVAAQLIWGGDAYSIPSHAMIGQPPIKLVLDLVSTGYRGDFASRFESYMELAPVGRILPPHAKVLVHERHTRLGLAAMSVNDAGGSQAGISYVLLRTPAAVNRLLHEFGVTHVLWSPGTAAGWESTGADLVFFEFAEKYARNRTTAAGLSLAEMPPLGAIPAVPEPRLVRFQSCAGPRTVDLADIEAAISGAPVPDAGTKGAPSFFVVQPGCGTVPPESQAAFRQVATRNGYALWISR